MQKEPKLSKRFSSAQVFKFGPITEGLGLAMIRERDKIKRELDDSRKKRSQERLDSDNKKRMERNELGRILVIDLDSSLKVVAELTVHQLDSCMLFYHEPLCKGKHAEKITALLSCRSKKNLPAF